MRDAVGVTAGVITTKTMATESQLQGAPGGQQLANGSSAGWRDRLLWRRGHVAPLPSAARGRSGPTTSPQRWHFTHEVWVLWLPIGHGADVPGVHAGRLDRGR